MNKSLKIVDNKKIKNICYTLYLPIKARVAVDIDISGNGILDKLKSENLIVYNKLLEKCHEKTPDTFMFIGRVDTIFVYADCKNIMKKAMQVVEKKTDKKCIIRKIVICDIERTVISEELNLHDPAYYQKWTNKDDDEIELKNFPSVILL
jgi:hypothetical protein|uniref:Uncharacterized protein n=1 Tax=viral metagenome TaxID=1070528 RepID=A0A6C0C1L4_9ZZZZ